MIDYKQVIKKAPLPFLGNKALAIKTVYTLLKDKDLNGVVFVDVFGGSGIISNLLKQMFPDARVIYNDFDDYSKRLENIDVINKHLRDLRKILKKHEIERLKPLTKNAKKEVKEYLENEIQKGVYVDVPTIVTNFDLKGVAANKKDLNLSRFYANKIRFTDIKRVDGYLKGVERVNTDFRKLIKETLELKPIYILDPPYIQTTISAYRDYFEIKEAVELMGLMREMGVFLYFTQTGNGAVHLLKYVLKDYEACKHFPFHSNVKKRT